VCLSTFWFRPLGAGDRIVPQFTDKDRHMRRAFRRWAQGCFSGDGAARRSRIPGSQVGVFAVLVVSGAIFSAPAQAATKPSFEYSVPGHYIANWPQRAQGCGGFLNPSFVTWTSYAGATVGSHWLVLASQTSLCKQAKKVGKKLIQSIQAKDGASFSRIDMQAYALLVGQQGISDDPIHHSNGVPRGWECFALPSEWGVDSWELARLASVGAPSEYEFAGASGAAAGAGYCVSGARSDPRGRWHGGNFISWAPNSTDCSNYYKLTEIPDPNFPGQFTVPPYSEAQIWGSYEELPCEGGAGVGS
jgi:hypothetical protein